jgi:hypothetical protein
MNGCDPGLTELRLTPAVRAILNELRTPGAPLADELRLLLADYAAVEAALARIIQMVDDWAQTADERPDGDGLARALEICRLEVILAADPDRMAADSITGAELVRSTGGDDAEPRTMVFRWDPAAAPMAAGLVETLATLVRKMQTLGDAERADARRDFAVAARGRGTASTPRPPGTPPVTSPRCWARSSTGSTTNGQRHAGLSLNPRTPPGWRARDDRL